MQSVVKIQGRVSTRIMSWKFFSNSQRFYQWVLFAHEISELALEGQGAMYCTLEEPAWVTVWKIGERNSLDFTSILTYLPRLDSSTTYTKTRLASTWTVARRVPHMEKWDTSVVSMHSPTFRNGEARNSKWASTYEFWKLLKYSQNCPLKPRTSALSNLVTDVLSEGTRIGKEFNLALRRRVFTAAVFFDADLKT